MRRTATLLLALLALLVPACLGLAEAAGGAGRTLQAVAYDCSAGCAERARAQPVCGADGMTYTHECLAVCQGTTVASTGPCSAAGLARLDVSAGIPAVSRATMQRFQAQGFKYVGQGKVDATKGPTLPRLTHMPAAAPTGANSARAVRFVYATKALYIMPPSSGTTSAAAMAAAAGDAAAAAVLPNPPPIVHARKLKAIIGTDDRRRVTPTTSQPASTVGYMVFGDATSSYTCSSSLIDSTSVLTAGHCVHPGDGSAFYQVKSWTPGQDGTLQPFGSFAAATSIAWVTTYVEWASSSNFAFDMAVFHLSQPVTNVGTFAMAPSNTYTSRTLVTAGYPGDKTRGTQWNATCIVSDSNPADGVTQLGATCDVFPGQSGSPVWEVVAGVRTIRGVISYQICRNPKRCANFANQMTTARFNDATAWAAAQ